MVNTTVWPTTDGFVEEKICVVVAATLTVTEAKPDVLPV
jgi:hypothetical protein